MKIHNVPSWYNEPLIKLEKLSLHPELYGFSKNLRNIDISNKVHQYIKSNQNGGDLTITARDWIQQVIIQLNNTYTEQDIYIAQDYINTAITYGWDTQYISEMYCLQARIYHFYSPKTTLNYQQAITWYTKSINLQFIPEAPPGHAINALEYGKALAYFQLYELLQYPDQYGFDSSLKNTINATYIYTQKYNFIKSFGIYGFRVEATRYTDSLLGKITPKYYDDWLNALFFCDEGLKLYSDSNTNQAEITYIYRTKALIQQKFLQKNSSNLRLALTNYIHGIHTYSLGPAVDHGVWAINGLLYAALPLVNNCSNEGFDQNCENSKEFQQLKSTIVDLYNHPVKYQCSDTAKNIISHYSNILKQTNK